MPQAGVHTPEHINVDGGGADTGTSQTRCRCCLAGGQDSACVPCLSSRLLCRPVTSLLSTDLCELLVMRSPPSCVTRRQVASPPTPRGAGPSHAAVCHQPPSL